MSNRPHVRKVGTWWRVYINGRMWSSTPRHAEAIERAHDIATYAHRIRFRNDTARIRAALDRMENHART